MFREAEKKRYQNIRAEHTSSQPRVHAAQCADGRELTVKEKLFTRRHLQPC